MTEAIVVVFVVGNDDDVVVAAAFVVVRPKRGQKGTDAHSVVPLMPDSFSLIDPGSNLSGMGVS